MSKEQENIQALAEPQRVMQRVFRMNRRTASRTSFVETNLKTILPPKREINVKIYIGTARPSPPTPRSGRAEPQPQVPESQKN